jgi:IS30 family transposase
VSRAEGLSVGVLERTAVTLTGIGGIFAMTTFVTPFRETSLEGLGWQLHSIGFVVFAVGWGFFLASAWKVSPRAAPLRWCVGTVLMLFYLPLFVFDDARSGVMTYAIAHGLQYLVFMYFVAAAPRERRRFRFVALVTCVVLGGLLLDWMQQESPWGNLRWAVYGAYLGVVMWHFLLDAADSQSKCNNPRQKRGDLEYSAPPHTTKHEEELVKYRQITQEERYRISALRQAGCGPAETARRLGRHRSTVSRELARNGSPWDGSYRPSKAQEQANGRRSRSRRNRRFEGAEWRRVEELLRQDWSPEQISGWLGKQDELAISHETIYRYVWGDRAEGGDLHRHLRCAAKQRRKRYGRYDSRGRLAGKRLIAERPASVERRRAVGHWEIDTVMGVGNTHCVVTLVERATGVTLIGKLKERTTAELNRRTIALIRKHPGKFLTITADNGTEFHSYREIERATGVKFYFATPHHAWERGTNENTNGLVRQYLPKRESMAHVSQRDCNRIAAKLNTRPRKRYDFDTPEEPFHVA